MKIHQLEVGSMQNFTYLLVDDNTESSIVIDPSWNTEYIKKLVQQYDLQVKYIVNTHHHFDHVLGNEDIAKITNAKIIQHKSSPLKHDISIENGDKIKFGNCELNVIHTPGHSQDGICLINTMCVFSGDTIFVGSFGRTDLPGGNAGQLYDSIVGILANLNDGLTIYPGHNYGSTNTSTIRQEKQTNIIFKYKNKHEFLNIFK